LPDENGKHEHQNRKQHARHEEKLKYRMRSFGLRDNGKKQALAAPLKAVKRSSAILERTYSYM